MDRPCKRCKMPTDSATGYCGPCNDRRGKSFAYDQRRGSSSSRGYGRRWEKARMSFLASNPLCVRCKEAGRIERATVVDHIIPHKGDETLFWDRAGNWQSLCVACHSRKTATEDGGFGNRK